MVDHYELLGVDPTATTPEIRAAFRRAANEFHPDHHPFVESGSDRSGTQRMTALNEAWWTLRDDRRRAAYDTQRSAAGPDPRPDAAPVARAPSIDTDPGAPMRRAHLHLLVLTMTLGVAVLAVMFVIAMSQSGY